RHLVPFEPEPGEVGAEFVGQLRARAGAIDVLDPENEAPAPLPREVVRDDCRERVTEMQRSVRARGETRHDHGSAVSFPARRPAGFAVDSRFVTGLTQ